MFQTRHASVSGSRQRKVHLFNAHAVVKTWYMCACTPGQTTEKHRAEKILMTRTSDQVHNKSKVLLLYRISLPPSAALWVKSCTKASSG